MVELPEEYRKYVETLPEKKRLLLLVRDELYGEGTKNDRWSRMEKDLRARLEGRPYVYEISERIEEDIAGICQLRGYEDEHDVDLADYL